MVLAGLSMPAFFAEIAAGDVEVASLFVMQTTPGAGVIVGHVLCITVLANLGKMFPLLCYRQLASWRQRLALSIGLWPRGAVGAGVLVLSLKYGLGGLIMTVAALCLALNLMLTGGFIVLVKRLVGGQTTTPLTSPPLTVEPQDH